jgi:hypothetical protein
VSDKIQISGVNGYDGEYDFDPAALTKGDLRIIKQISGVRAGEMEEAAVAGDVDVVVAFAVIALKNAGHPLYKQFDKATDDVPLGQLKITYIAEEEADAADPQNVPSKPA